ncbi:MAG: hypothetical protein HC877_03645 [Thioploca sp.]|nr:hypothetical protein [Thioploca sp.]
MKLNKLLFFILMFLGFSKVLAATDCTQVTQIPQIECEALVALYDSTNGSGWNNKAGWNVTNTPCSWYGVSCASNHVSIIDLNSNELVGLIPAELGNFSYLQWLILRDNRLSGSIPPELGNLSNLQWLYLYRNQLTGLIPAELGNLSNLKRLCLHVNQLTGSISPELGKLSNLRYLYLSSNQLAGSIPPELGKLSNLQLLYLHRNRLSDPIPIELSNLNNLQVLSLGYNQLSGLIPPELGNLSNLQELYLLSNQLCGNIPLSLLNLTNLKFLYLRSNGLNITNLDPALKAFFDSLEQISWEPQNPAPTVCKASLATLAFFRAVPSPEKVLLKWQMLSEYENAGFYIWRGQPNGSQCTSHLIDYHDIVPIDFEVSKSNGFSGITYFYQDHTVKPKTTYCYLLEDRDFGGNSTFHWDSIVSVTTD